MGSQNVKLASNYKELNNFTKNLLKDIQALERMLEDEWFNKEPIHIGAEQEICLVDKHCKPAPLNLEVLKRMNNDKFTTELAKFNIEANLDPLELKDDCFSTLELELNDLLTELQKTCDELDIDFVLTGILPTVRKFDIEIDNLTPIERYDALLKAISKFRGKQHELRISGLDELNVKHDTALIESCNTSYQVHLQITPEQFVPLYNISQVLAAPVMAIACNSPLLFGKRLWSETRVALFQQSIDTRVTSEHFRDRSPRVFFGNNWLNKSIVEIYKEDIMRFRAMMTAPFDHDAFDQLEEGITPNLNALMIHNSTIYRWNRPCYGISPNGKPHLRIENRVLPSGPSVLDEVANSAFWIGLMKGFHDLHTDITKHIDFDQVKDNFIGASRRGLNTEMNWFNGHRIGVTELIKKELLPIARSGLENQNVKPEDIDRYLGVIEERNTNRMNGSTWLLESHAQLMKETSREEVSVAITASMIKNQKKGLPIHQWEMASLNSIDSWDPKSMLVEEFMTTDIFTVHPNDLPELVGDIMDWRKLKYIPVEDEKGNLRGLVNFQILLNYFSHRYNSKTFPTKTVKDIMIKKPITISPDDTVIEALKTMKKNKIGCMPVIKKDKLIGIISEGDFLNITTNLFTFFSNKKSKSYNQKI
ncbi:MAG TPA: glutamate-cysteine ligase family protein [Cyclobacteriaceae bacterium]